LTDPANPAKPGPSGISGWLHLLAMLLWLSAIGIVVELGRSAGDYARVWKIANGKAIVLAELAIYLVVLGLSVAAASALYKRKKRFRELFTWLWLAAVLLPAVDVALVAWLFPEFSSSELIGELARIGMTFVVMGVWVWYVQVSKRVANTCTN
jgi:ABC-type spermidine/putrescine transport system permease subunit II